MEVIQALIIQRTLVKNMMNNSTLIMGRNSSLSRGILVTSSEATERSGVTDEKNKSINRSNYISSGFAW